MEPRPGLQKKPPAGWARLPLTREERLRNVHLAYHLDKRSRVPRGQLTPDYLTSVAALREALSRYLGGVTIPPPGQSWEG